MRNRWWWKLGLLGLALVLALEVGLRVVLGLGHPVLMQANATYGYMAQPNQDLHRFFSHIQINSAAMRSPEFAAQKSPGSPRILFVGDSVTFGTTTLDQDQIFTSLVAGELAAAGAPVEVLNASSGGWAPANELGFLKARGTYGADLVVSVINTQDLTQSFEDFHDNILNPTRNPTSAIWELLRRYVAPKVFPALQVRDAGSDSRGDPPIEAKTPQVLQTLAEMQRLAQAAGARYLIIYVPTAHTAQGEYHAHWQKGADMLQDWARTAGVPLIDLGPALSRAPSTTVFIDGTHLKPLGHEIVARAFDDFYLHAAPAR